MYLILLALSLSKWTDSFQGAVRPDRLHGEFVLLSDGKLHLLGTVDIDHVLQLLLELLIVLGGLAQKFFNVSLANSWSVPAINRIQRRSAFHLV